jgi:hypothetical protein
MGLPGFIGLSGYNPIQESKSDLCISVAYDFQGWAMAVCYHSPIDFRDGELSSLPPDYLSKTTFPAFITVNCNRLIFTAVF